MAIEQDGSHAREQLDIVYTSIDKLIPYVNNARTHTDEQVTQIASSIKEFGWTNPILVDEKNGVIAGHGRLAAAKKLQLDEVPTILLSNLSDAQKKAYVLADNKLAQNAGWDDELLKLELSELKEMNFNIDLIGFDAIELDDLLKDPDFDKGIDDDMRLDQGRQIKCPHCGEEFNMFDVTD
tara:strand:+ start:1023 stop:1565 length:543 start_codon:yes stop_codon:yes gene_type:complete